MRCALSVVDLPCGRKPCRDHEYIKKQDGSTLMAVLPGYNMTNLAFQFKDERFHKFDFRHLVRDDLLCKLAQFSMNNTI